MNNHQCVAYKQLKRTARLLVTGFLLGIIQTSNVYADQSGKDIMENRCAMCHDLPDPANLTDEQWVLKLETMADFAGLSGKEKGKILEYVTSHEKKAVKIVSMAREKRLFEQKCTLCHTTDRVFLMPLTPESRRHIVLRMQERAPDMISLEDAHEILEYLNHGAPEAVKPEARKPTSDGPAATFRERCTACHSAERVYLKLQESKEQGNAVAWGHIVSRMREKAPDWITESEAKQILEYLASIKAVKNE